MIWNSTGGDILLDPAIKVLQATTLVVPRSPGKIKFWFVANMPIVRWTGWSLKQEGEYEFNLDKMTKDQRNLILKFVRQVLAGFLSE